MRLVLLVICLSLLTVSCAHNYTKSGASSRDFKRDNNDCLVKAGQAGYHSGDFGDNVRKNRFIDQCLQGQGWDRI